MQKSEPNRPDAPQELSLRERNRLDTWLAIHNAAADLVLERGWSATTVEQIAARARISNRTFFNYFSSKEDAVLGAQTPRLPQPALEAFRSGEQDLIHRAVYLTAAVMRASYPHDELRARRQRIIGSFPEVGVRLKRLAAEVEQLVEPAVAEEIERISTEEGISLERGTRDAAKAITLHASTIIRFAFAKDPSALSDDHADLVDTAIITFREVIQSSTWLK
ncbi:TetR/AcrR family transcriptional regulator [Gulosibacter sp. 10]|uniref:TetR/AcrR family transcriptional regulator n=1 Tax=Gulosibacter sp. 10 TaxID=1255570 RepID=UPI00097EF523|nr:TetR/AcrR family transcriptional regulator [Gulosibacter sp. 10]SJM57018.1 Transcriptional regulator, TetR family [Gulosibacter sp. 10]